VYGWAWWIALSAFFWTGAALGDELHLTGQMNDAQGKPMAGETFRLVLGSDPGSRQPGSGHRLTTDAQGRFTLRTPVALSSRRIRLDSLFARHESRLLELGLEFDLLGQPALYWVEVDFTRHGALRGISAYLAGREGRFDMPLTFHPREHAWSIPGDPLNLRLSDIGADVLVTEANNGEAGLWRIDIAVTRQRFEMR